MISEKKVRVETPYGVKIFQNFYSQNISPIIPNIWAKNFFKIQMFQPPSLHSGTNIVSHGRLTEDGSCFIVQLTLIIVDVIDKYIKKICLVDWSESVGVVKSTQLKNLLFYKKNCLPWFRNDPESLVKNVSNDFLIF